MYLLVRYCTLFACHYIFHFLIVLPNVLIAFFCCHCKEYRRAFLPLSLCSCPLFRHCEECRKARRGNLLLSTPGIPIQLQPNYQRLLRAPTGPRNDRPWGPKGKRGPNGFLGPTIIGRSCAMTLPFLVIARNAPLLLSFARSAARHDVAIPTPPRHCEEGRSPSEAISY